MVIFASIRQILRCVVDYPVAVAIFCDMDNNQTHHSSLRGSSEGAQARRPVQLRLWPAADDDALIYQSSSAYRGLDETGQRVVRGYLMALEATGDWPTQSRIASLTGLSRSTVSAHLARGSAEMAAVTEILSACRTELAQRTTVAIPALAALIVSQFFPSEGGRLARDTRTLTKTELEVLTLATAMGGVAVGPSGQPASLLTVSAQSSPDGGQTVAAQIALPSGTTPTLADMLSKLRAGQTQHGEVVFERPTADFVQSSGCGDFPGGDGPSAAVCETATKAISAGCHAPDDDDIGGRPVGCV